VPSVAIDARSIVPITPPAPVPPMMYSESPIAAVANPARGVTSATPVTVENEPIWPLLTAARCSIF